MLSKFFYTSYDFEKRVAFYDLNIGTYIALIIILITKGK